MILQGKIVRTDTSAWTRAARVQVAVGSLDLNVLVSQGLTSEKEC